MIYQCLNTHDWEFIMLSFLHSGNCHFKNLVRKHTRTKHFNRHLKLKNIKENFFND